MYNADMQIQQNLVGSIWTTLQTVLHTFAAQTDETLVEAPVHLAHEEDVYASL